MAKNFKIGKLYIDIIEFDTEKKNRMWSSIQRKVWYKEMFDTEKSLIEKSLIQRKDR